jgi:hypothetical protein
LHGASRCRLASGWFFSMGVRMNALGIEVDSALEIAEKIDI